MRLDRETRDAITKIFDAQSDGKVEMTLHQTWLVGILESVAIGDVMLQYTLDKCHYRCKYCYVHPGGKDFIRPPQKPTLEDMIEIQHQPMLDVSYAECKTIQARQILKEVGIPLRVLKRHGSMAGMGVLQMSQLGSVRSHAGK